MMKLTPRQQQILDFIRSTLESRGAPPTRAEISAAFGFASPNAAEEHLKALAKKGAIHLEAGAARGIRLIDDTLGTPLPVQVSAQPGLPLIGSVAAGSPILAIENVQAHYAMDPQMFQPKADFLLRVRGLSMMNVGILEGDLLAVHKTSEAREGQIVVARVDDEVTVKRFAKKSGRISLLPENPDFEPIVIGPETAEFAIEGIAVGLIRGGF